MLHAVIMAGGAGTRFWPESRAARPKQLLRLAGERTMLQETVARLDNLVPPDRVLVVTNMRLVGAVREQLTGLLPADSILGEPCKRDTAPCIGWAALHILRRDSDATMVVMPSDHLICPAERFQDAVRVAAALAELRPSRIVTFGVRPSYPAETFGYIEGGAPLAGVRGVSAREVVRFREKPAAAVAREYLRAGTFFWNSGIFVWKARTIADALARFEPTLYQRLCAIDAAAGSPDYEEVLEKEFSAMKSISIDYAVMERAEDVVVVEAPFDWDDVGNWEAIARIQGAGDEGNVQRRDERTLFVDSRDCVVRGSPDHLVVLVGMRNCLVVHTPDATLVADRGREESIRRVVKLLEERGWHQYL